MRIFSGILTVLGVVLMAGSAQADEKIDCGYPLNQAERSYCADKALEQAEADMSAALTRALAKMTEVDSSLPDHLKGSPDALETAQTAWLDFREKDCTAYSFPFKGGTRGTELYRNCMIVMTMQRTDDLNAMVDDYGG
ncbi:lysozyme inhibitor LprI family protein [Roseibium sp.]|uniref:lysozyme inhibitor LprI family protein n=1 Tax=Roseibium sp. TaxID=1936156 RepID=UPI003B51D180